MKSGSVVIASGYFYVAGVVVVAFHIRELLALIQSSHMKLTKKNTLNMLSCLLPIRDVYATEYTILYRSPLYLYRVSSVHYSQRKNQ